MNGAEQDKYFIVSFADTLRAMGKTRDEPAGKFFKKNHDLRSAFFCVTQVRISPNEADEILLFLWVRDRGNWTIAHTSYLCQQSKEASKA